MEAFANAIGLLPEQVWDEPDRTGASTSVGRPTGSAMPLMWAHAEYIKLLRSVTDGQVFDLIPAITDRYLKRRVCSPLEIWKFNRQPRSVVAGMGLRIQAQAAFRLRWTANGWQETHDTRSIATALGIEFVDLPIGPEQRAPIRFTFYWVGANRWDGRDFKVEVKQIAE
jgi:glucoamylase